MISRLEVDNKLAQINSKIENYIVIPQINNPQEAIGVFKLSQELYHNLKPIYDEKKQALEKFRDVSINFVIKKLADYASAHEDEALEVNEIQEDIPYSGIEEFKESVKTLENSQLKKFIEEEILASPQMIDFEKFQEEYQQFEEQYSESISNYIDLNALEQKVLKLLRIYADHAYNIFMVRNHERGAFNFMNIIHHMGGEERVKTFIKELNKPEINTLVQANELIAKFFARHEELRSPFLKFFDTFVGEPEMGLHTSSFDTAFLQVLFNEGSPIGLFTTSFSLNELNKLKLKKLTSDKIPEPSLQGLIVEALRGDKRLQDNRTFIRDTALEFLTKITATLTPSPSLTNGDNVSSIRPT